MASKEKDLGELHVLLTETYRTLVKDMMESGEINAQLLNSLRQFLKDNEISCDRATADEMARSFDSIISKIKERDKDNSDFEIQ